MKRYLLGIDVGTTGTKSILFSEDGEIKERAYKSYPNFEPAEKEREQNAEDLWDAVKETSRAVCRGYENQVYAISLSTQGGTLIPTDKNFNPIRPAILWSDTRCEKEKNDFIKMYGEAYIYETTGWKAAPRFTPMEVRYLKDHEELEADYYLSVPSFISAKMTGIPAVDLSNAGIEQTVNIQTGKYDEKLLAYADIKENQLAKIVPTCQVVGKVTKEAAELLGVNPETVLISGAHDQYASISGTGVFKSGDGMLGSGTAWAMTALSEKLDFSLRVSQSIGAVPGTFGRISSVPDGGICLDAFKTENHIESFQKIDRYAATEKAWEEGLFFLPENGRKFAGKPSDNLYKKARAIMEGVCFAAKRRFLLVSPDSASIHFTGGATKSDLWSQMTSDIFGIPLVIPNLPDTTCLGAALIAGYGSGVFDSFESGYKKFNIPTKILYPNEEKVKLYAEAFEKYKELIQG